MQITEKVFHTGSDRETSTVTAYLVGKSVGNDFQAADTFTSTDNYVLGSEHLFIEQLAMNRPGIYNFFYITRSVK